MKKIILSLSLFLLSNFTWALEIQCIEGTNHVTIVESIESGIVYLVIDDGENLLNYIALNKDFIISSKENFSYVDEILEISLSKDKEGLVFSKDPLYQDVKTIFPTNCKFLN